MKFKAFTFDALFSPKKKAFKSSKAAESEFYRALKRVAHASGNLVTSHIDGVKIHNEAALMKQLRKYSETLEPWAKRQAEKMLERVSKKSKAAYKANSLTIAQTLKVNLSDAHVDETARTMMEEQVKLIKSIPLEAGERAQSLAMSAVLEGGRADEIAKELMRTTEVTESRAKLIAITETARANASITEARATSIGVKGYIWRTTMDGAERHSHAEMNGKFVEYKKPPTLSDGTTGHAGTFPRCRCWQDPVFDD